ncbi:hypothetical protein AA0X95_03740 [Bacillus sp. 1P10SD]|uniref:hypothetical protein n=1 Tax=Bacillus sp. 1P10SD TaxID=3132265 RepID=UPI0039A41413
MLLYFPKQFDANEWTILIGILFNFLVFKLLPNRMSKEITPLICLLSISFPKVMDHTMAVKPFNLYDLTDSSKYELFDVALYGVFPAFGFLFINIYEYFNLKGPKLVVYLVIWSFFSVGFEFLLVKLHVFVYTGWKLVFSLPIYIVVLSLTLLFYKFLIFYKNQENI